MVLQAVKCGTESGHSIEMLHDSSEKGGALADHTAPPPQFPGKEKSWCMDGQGGPEWHASG